MRISCMLSRKGISICEGSCENHSGRVRRVVIGGSSSFAGIEFNYCENAIKEDERRGFTIKHKNNEK